MPSRRFRRSRGAATTAAASAPLSSTNLARKSKVGWAKYFQLVRETQGHARTMLHGLTHMTAPSQPNIPQHIKDELQEMAKQLEKTYNCPICLTCPDADHVHMTDCGHRFCSDCWTILKTPPPGATTPAASVCPICRAVLFK